MFFDQSSVDTEYLQLLMAIARQQRQLLLYRFDWDNRTPKQWPPSGLFGRKDKKAIACYENMCLQLEQLKSQTIAHRRKQGYPNKTFWWNLPWEQVENYLLCDLAEISETGPWRYQRDWETEQGEDCDFLLLRENGHCSNFSSSSTTNYAKESIYSDAQQSAMVGELRAQQKDFNFRSALFSDDRPVYSYKSKTVYASQAHYINSFEHYMHQQNQLERFERSLYTEHITREVNVVSNSRHYECVYVVGGYHVDNDGLLDFVAPLDFELIGSRGSVPEDAPEAYPDKDATVAIAAFLADQAAVRQVPMQLFGRDIMDAAPDYAEAMRQAELYTCLAHKIKYMD